MRGFGYYLGSRPVTVVLVTLSVIAALSSLLFIYPLQIITDVRRGFAHRNGRSTEEFKVFGNFYNVSMEDLELMVVLIEAKDKGKLEMTSDLLEEVVRLDKAIRDTNVTSVAHSKLFTFQDITTRRGSINFLFDAFKASVDPTPNQPQLQLGFDMQVLNQQLGLPLDPDIHLDAPFASIYEHKFLTIQHFFGMEMYPRDNVSRVSQIKAVQSVGLWYMLQAPIPNRAGRELLRDMELKIFNMSQHNFSGQFNFYMYADEVANHEMMVGSMKTIHLLGIGAVLMVLFMLFALRDFHLRDSVLLLAAAISSPMLAMLVTFSLLCWMGIPFNGVMSIAPFLILGIGVDDAFLLLHAWRGLAVGKDKKSEIEANKWLEQVVAEVGPSILITSITNTLAFSVGILSPAYTMMSFCVCTAIAVTVHLVLEFLLFGPALVLILPIPKANAEQKIENSIWFKYAGFLVSKLGRVVFVIVVGLLCVFAFFGIHQMNPNFEPEKTFPFDSHLQESLRPIKTLYKEYGPMSLIVNKAPDVSNETDLVTFMSMVETIEALHETYDSHYTQLWLRQYVEYFEQKLPNETLSYKLVPDFLAVKLMQDKNIVIYHLDDNGDVHVDSFVLLIICHGERDWHSRAFFVDKVRSIVDSYPQFQASVFDYDATIFDLIITAKPEMIKAVLVTLVCMVIVCFVIIPSPKHTGIATLSVLSISYSLVGALGWWGQDMDPVTMTNVLMAIGFSVDFSAHVCYHYFKQERADAMLGLRTARQDLVYRLAHVLGHVGRPTFEAASSTVLCMLPLFTVQMYVIMAFAKTVMCVGALGILHGLFLVPSILTLHCSCCKDKARLKESRSTDSNRPLILTAPLV